jgi:hypothetical protein
MVMAMPAWVLARTMPEAPLAALGLAAPLVAVGWLWSLRSGGHPLWPELTAAAARLRGRAIATGSAP